MPLFLDDSCLSESGSPFLVPSFDPRTLCPQSSSCRSTLGEFPTSGTTPNAKTKASLASLSVPREAVAKLPCMTAVGQRDLPPLPCGLRDSHRAQGRRHGWRLGRTILQQRHSLCLRHHNMPLVAPDGHDHRYPHFALSFLHLPGYGLFTISSLNPLLVANPPLPALTSGMIISRVSLRPVCRISCAA